MEDLRKGGCFIMDRRQKNAAQMSPGKASTVPSSNSVEMWIWECCSKEQIGSVKYKETGCSSIKGLLFQCLYCGDLEAALCKMIKVFSRSSN